MTNAEKIRAMTDEEMADEFLFGVSQAIEPGNLPETHRRMRTVLARLVERGGKVMSFEEAFEALKQLRNDIDPEYHLFVGTINPAWLDVIIARLEEVSDNG